MNKITDKARLKTKALVQEIAYKQLDALRLEFGLDIGELKITVNQSSYVSRGGEIFIKNKGVLPYIFIAIKGFISGIDSSTTKHYEYKHISGDKDIGTTGSIPWHEKLRIIVAHELAHAVDFVAPYSIIAPGDFNHYDCDGSDGFTHGCDWQYIYSKLRGYEICLKDMPKTFREFIE